VLSLTCQKDNDWRGSLCFSRLGATKTSLKNASERAVAVFFGGVGQTNAKSLFRGIDRQVFLIR
jgi:hypothetical protein